MPGHTHLPNWKEDVLSTGNFQRTDNSTTKGIGRVVDDEHTTSTREKEYDTVRWRVLEDLHSHDGSKECLMVVLPRSLTLPCELEYPFLIHPDDLFRPDPGDLKLPFLRPDDRRFLHLHPPERP